MATSKESVTAHINIVRSFLSRIAENNYNGDELAVNVFDKLESACEFSLDGPVTSGLTLAVRSIRIQIDKALYGAQ